jgi:hypothetical protein
VGDTRLLINFSINGEYPSNTLSERRGCILRASAQVLMVRLSKNTGSNKGPVCRNIARHLRQAPLLFWYGSGLLMQRRGYGVLRSSLDRGVAQLMRRHPSATFLLLTFGITCIVWVPRAAGVPVGVVGQV